MTPIESETASCYNADMENKPSKFVAYIRVSTVRQGESGLGLEAQSASIANYVKSVGGEIEKTFVEVESGTLAQRPQLNAALLHAKRTKSVLIIAKLDRLARNVAFVSALMESGADFRAVDNPHANRLTLHILAAVAEDEARRISERTKAALAAARARGTILGSARPGHWLGREAARLAGARKGNAAAAAARRRLSQEALADVLPTIKSKRESGETLQSIARYLNEQGKPAVQGGSWTPMQISRAVKM